MGRKEVWAVGPPGCTLQADTGAPEQASTLTDNGGFWPVLSQFPNSRGVGGVEMGLGGQMGHLGC